MIGSAAHALELLQPYGLSPGVLLKAMSRQKPLTSLIPPYPYPYLHPLFLFMTDLSSRPYIFSALVRSDAQWPVGCAIP